MKKILIVDDEIDILKVIKYRLIKQGYEVFSAVNGRDGLDQVKLIKPDLILMDLSMPLLNGNEACKLLKADPVLARIPIIIMTASAKGVQDENVRLIGADDSILKPFEPQVLLEKIKKYVG